ncbi:DUF5995 family protein [Balneola sp. MJW-20]|uniref:DUF5995 family protein n=1 Tax=Gracilimonas aurantiaca TaxID=3234185 RepID=UPI0034679867
MSVLNEMDRYISTWKNSGDRRYIFLSCYRTMTANMLQALKDSRFKDPLWVEALLNHFAKYYFRALECYDCGNHTPLVWQQVHSITRKQEHHILQHLIIGVNAHINYDLVLSLYDILQPEWSGLDKKMREIRYSDHCTVNYIIASTVDTIQEQILNPEDPKIRWIDLILGQLDEYLISALISSWREKVWVNTERLLETTGESEFESIRLEIEKDALSFTQLIT